MNPSAPYRAMHQSAVTAGQYLELLRSMDDVTLLRCYNHPNKHTQQHHQDMIRGVLEDRGISV